MGVFAKTRCLNICTSYRLLYVKEKPAQKLVRIVPNLKADIFLFSSEMDTKHLFSDDRENRRFCITRFSYCVQHEIICFF